MVRIGIVGLVLSMLGGFAASVVHLVWHHENRDERPEFSVDDLKGAYHGIRTEAPMRAALESGHPDDLPDRERELLLAWLGNSERMGVEFDNLDKGEDAPSEIMASFCFECHAGNAEAGAGINLEYWDEVESVSTSREVTATPVRVLAMSTHTHALTLSAMSLVIVCLALSTSWSRRLVGLGIMLMGVSLAGDLAGWWLARQAEGLVWLVIVGGGVYNGTSVLLLLAVLVDLVMPQSGDSNDS